jgi:Zn-dependent protease with chaperone function
MAARGTLDFFGAQAAARRRTVLLVVLFFLAWALTVALADLGVAAVLSLSGQHAGAGLSRMSGQVLRPAVGLDRLVGLVPPVALAVSAIVVVGFAYHALSQGRDGGDAVARMLGGRPVDRFTQDLGEKRAVNVLEEMAIAAGLPVPRLYVLETEGGINAFAAGPSPERAVVAVTRGALDQLDRDELQGVLAHELSHVLNADARLNLRLMALLGGLTALALVGRVLLRAMGSGSGRRRGGIALVGLVGLALLVAGAVGVFFGRLIQAAVSRQREFLADAAAVQFTRNPGGLAGALEKVRGLGSALSTPHASEASHLFFAEGVTGFWAGLFSTHPPLAERCRRLLAGAPAGPRRPAAGTERAGAPGPAAGRPALGAMGLAAPASVGRPGPEHLAAAVATLASFPAPVAQAAHEPYGARALSLAMLLDADPAIRTRQLGAIAAGPTLSAELVRLGAALATVPRDQRLALLDLALPALDTLSADQAARLIQDLATLAAGDGRTTLFEWALQRLVRRRLAPRLGERPAAARLRAVEQVEVEALELLSALAWAGQRDPEAAQRALDAGVQALQPGAPWRLLPRERMSSALLDSCLARLEEAEPALKARLLGGATACVLADQRVIAPEAELLRAISATLGLPMPALVPDGAQDTAA